MPSWEDPELVNLPAGINMVTCLFREKNVLEGRRKYRGVAPLEIFLAGTIMDLELESQEWRVAAPPGSLLSSQSI